MSAFGGDKKIVAPNVTLGEFAVAEELLQSLSANQKRTEYSEKELNQMGWSTFTDDGKTYLYQGICRKTLMRDQGFPANIRRRDSYDKETNLDRGNACGFAPYYCGLREIP